MTAHSLALPGLDELSGPLSYPGSRLAFVGDLFRYPEPVARGMARELERLAVAGIPAFADGRRVWTPQHSFFITLSGEPSRWLTSAVNFEDRARHAVRRMATDATYSFNQPFAERYLKEETPHA